MNTTLTCNSPEETAWEKTLYEIDNLDFSNLDTEDSTNNGVDRHQSLAWLDNPTFPVRNLDMTEQNYEEQAAEAEAARQNPQPAPPKKDSEPAGEEELEDTFHINLDYD